MANPLAKNLVFVIRLASGSAQGVRIRLPEAVLFSVGSVHMANRKMCSHRTDSTVVIFVTWCARCAGWRYVRALEEQGSLWGSASDVPSESHFLPQEEVGPSDLLALMTRAFQTAAEVELDRRAKRVY